MKHLTRLAISFVLLVAFVTPAHAYVFGFSDSSTSVELILNNGGMTLNPFDLGWYGVDGFHITSNENYIVSRSTEAFSCVGPCNNFFAFDTANIRGTVTTAELRLDSFGVTTTDTYSLFDYTGSIPSLLAGTGGVAAHADLGSGISYGSRLYSPADTNLFRSISLNGAFVSALNDAIINESLFAFGGTIEPGQAPEPATMTLTGLGLLGLFMARRRQRGATD